MKYSLLRKTQKKSKKKSKLLKLDSDFYSSISEEIQTKEKMLEKKSNSKMEYELDNFKSLTKNIFWRRVKKIIFLAIHETRRGTKEKDRVLPEERDFFESLLSNLNQLEKNVLGDCFEDWENQR